VLGCSTLEFALVAAGLLSFAFLSHPKLWDVAAGLALLESVGCRALAPCHGGWDTLLYFRTAGDDSIALAQWSEPVLIGDELALERALALRGGAG